MLMEGQSGSVLGPFLLQLIPVLSSPVAAAEGSGAGCGAGRDHTTAFPQGPLPQEERDWVPLFIT